MGTFSSKMAASPSFVRKLKALEYPWAEEDLNGQSMLPFPRHKKHVALEKVQRCIHWVELNHLQCWKEKEQATLIPGAGDWVVALRKYLVMVQYPRELPSSRPSAQQYLHVVDWIVTKAISMRYREKAESYNAQHKAVPEWVLEVDVEDPAFAKAVHGLGAALGFPKNPDTKETLKAISDVISYRFAAHIQEEERIPTVDEAMELLRSASFPLGFTTGDEKVDVACVILRLLYTAKLGELQLSINQVIATLQGYTLNPRMDPRLGKVGK